MTSDDGIVSGGVVESDRTVNIVQCGTSPNAHRDPLQSDGVRRSAIPAEELEGPAAALRQ